MIQATDATTGLPVRISRTRVLIDGFKLPKFSKASINRSTGALTILSVPIGNGADHVVIIKPSSKYIAPTPFIVNVNGSKPLVLTIQLQPR